MHSLSHVWAFFGDGRALQEGFRSRGSLQAVPPLPRRRAQPKASVVQASGHQGILRSICWVGLFQCIFCMQKASGLTVRWVGCVQGGHGLSGSPSALASIWCRPEPRIKLGRCPGASLLSLSPFFSHLLPSKTEKTLQGPWLRPLLNVMGEDLGLR